MERSSSNTALAAGELSAKVVSPLDLLAVWRETLGDPDAGMDENFFDAGGTSLLAARMAARMKAQLGCSLTAADILAHPSVRQLLKKVSGGEPNLDRSLNDKRATMQRKAFQANRPAR